MPTPLKVYHVDADDCPAEAKYIGRGTPCGNPFIIGRDGTRAEVIAKFKVTCIPVLRANGALESLRGYDLKCHCKPLDCHGDVLLVEANR